MLASAYIIKDTRWDSHVIICLCSMRRSFAHQTYWFRVFSRTQLFLCLRHVHYFGKEMQVMSHSNCRLSHCLHKYWNQNLYEFHKIRNEIREGSGNENCQHELNLLYTRVTLTFSCDESNIYFVWEIFK